MMVYVYQMIEEKCKGKKDRYPETMYLLCLTKAMYNGTFKVQGSFSQKQPLTCNSS